MGSALGEDERITSADQTGVSFEVGRRSAASDYTRARVGAESAEARRSELDKDQLAGLGG